MLLTMIVRVADSLPLAASMQEDEQVTRATDPYDNNNISVIDQWCEPTSTQHVYKVKIHDVNERV